MWAVALASQSYDVSPPCTTWIQVQANGGHLCAPVWTAGGIRRPRQHHRLRRRPRVLSRRPGVGSASTRAVASTIAVCPSWPHACITPSCSDANPSPLASWIGSASRSALNARDHPGLIVLADRLDRQRTLDLPRFRRHLNASGRKPGKVRFWCRERGRRIRRSSAARRSV